MGGAVEDKMVDAGCERCFISLMVSAGKEGGRKCQEFTDNMGWQATKAATRQPTV